jgi:hypothetical protein
MSLRIQKSWAQLGSPKQAGPHSVRGVGKIVNLSETHISEAAALDGNANVVLTHADAPGMVPHWEILEIRPMVEA